jgi:hypothetical protein
MKNEKSRKQEQRLTDTDIVGAFLEPEGRKVRRQGGTLRGAFGEKQGRLLLE